MSEPAAQPSVASATAPVRFLGAAYSAYRAPRAGTWPQRGALLALCLLASALSSCFVLKVLWQATEMTVCLGVTAAYVALVATLLFASKQLRCVSLLVVPALGTKRGRGYLLYAVVALLTAHTAPNTFHNIGALGEVSLCKALSGIQGIINNTARREAIVREYTAAESQTVKETLNFHTIASNYIYSIKTKDVSTEIGSLRVKIESVKRNVSADFKTLQATMEMVQSVVSKTASLASVILVLLLSGAYLRSYLTDVLFDNIYITEELRSLARRTDPSGEAMRCLKADGKWQLIDPTALRLSSKEMESWPLSIVTLFAWLLLVSLALGVEYGVHALAATLLAMAEAIPPAHAEVRLHYEVYIEQALKARHPVTKMVRKPRFPLVFAPCPVALAPPALHVTVGVYALLLLAFALVFLGSYANRLRRKIAATFFPEVESKRVLQLHARMKTLHRHKLGQKPLPRQLSQGQASEQLPGRLVSEQLPGRLVSEQLPGRLASEQLPGRLVLEQLPGRLVSEQLPGRLVSEQLPGRLVLEQLPGQVVFEQMPKRGSGARRWKGAPAPNRVVGKDRSEVSVSAGRPERVERIDPTPMLVLRHQLEQALEKKRRPVPEVASTAV